VSPASSTSPATTTVVTAPFLAVVAAGAFFFFGIGVTLPILPRYVQDDLGGSDLMVGVVVATFAFSAVLARPLAGRLGNKRGRRWLMIVGASLTAASLAGYGAVHEEWQLILVRLVTGVGDALFFTGSATLVADMAPPERRGQALSYFSITAYLGQGLGPTLGESVASASGRPWAFVVGGALAGLGALAAVRAPDVRPTLAPLAPGEEPVRQPLVNRKALGPGAVLGLGLMGFTAFAVYVPLYAPSLGMGGSKFVFLVYAAVVMTVRLVGARLPDRLGVLRTGTIATSSIAAGLVLTALWARPAGLYLGSMVLGVGMALQYPALMAMAVNRATEQERSSVVGSFTAFFDLAGGTGGIVLGTVVSLGGYRAGFLGGAVCALAALALLRLRVGRVAP
jgi:MFS family permease